MMKKGIIVLLLALCIGTCVSGCGNTKKESKEELKYQMAEELLANGKFDEAAVLFKALGSYQDASQQYEEAIIKSAKALLDDGKYEEAIEQLKGIDLESAKEIVSEAYYELGNQYMKETKYKKAIQQFEKSSSDDAQEQIKECNYQIAVGYYMDGDYESAQEEFKKIGGYRDAADLYEDCHKKVQAAQEIININYVVNQSDEEIEGTTYKNGEGVLKFGTDIPLDDWLGAGDEGYVTYCNPESAINFTLENVGERSVNNLCVRFDFTGVYLENVFEPFVGENHIHGVGGYASAVLYPGTLNGKSTSSLYTFYMSEAYFENHQDATLTITISGDDYPARTYEVPLQLKSNY